MKIKSCVWLVCLLFCLPLTSQSQILKLENGFAVSSFRYYKVNMNSDKIKPYQFSAGLEYLDKGWFNLSSSIGYLTKGGKELFWNENSTTADLLMQDKLHYLTLNTTFDVKKTTRRGFTFFVGAGPRIDFKLKATTEISGAGETTEKRTAHGYDAVSFGLKCVGGIKTDIGKNFQIGVNVAYLPSFIPVDRGIRDRTFTVGLTLGYRLNPKELYGESKNAASHTVRKRH